MANISSKVTTFLGRLVKVIMVIVLLPLAIGLLMGILGQLELVTVSGAAARGLVERGFMTYVWLHLLLYRPVPLFRVSHRLFSALAVWLFGAQVASVEGQGGGKGKAAKGAKADSGSQGSTLVAFSPYVIPSYMVLVCVVGWVLTRWVDRAFVDRPVLMLIGVTSAFHWLMTADDLQQQRARWHLETYLLAIGLIFVLTLLMGGACLPFAIPEFSFVQALSDGVAHAQATYTTIIQRLFL